MSLTDEQIQALPSGLRTKYSAMLEQRAGDVAETPAAEAAAAATQDPSQTAENTATVAAPAEAAPEEIRAPADDGYRHKYDVLEGKYRAEVPRLHARIRDLEGECVRLSDALSAATARPAEPAPAAPAETSASNIDAEAAEYGFDAETVKMLRKLARAEVADDLKRVDNIERTATEIATERKAAAIQKHVDALTAAVPDWSALWADEDGFQPWLTATGRRDPLLAADAAHNVSVMSDIFAAYKREHQQATPDTKPAASADLARHVEPDRGRATKLPGEKPTMKRADMDRLRHDQIAGRISFDEFTKQIRAFAEAERDGRLM